jgi:predicted transcriptional regulator
LGKAWAFLQIRLDPDLKQAFDDICAKEQRSQSYVAETLIRTLVERRTALRPTLTVIQNSNGDAA